MDDLTCPSLLIEEDSDYGSRDTSDNDVFVIGHTPLLPLLHSSAQLRDHPCQA